MVSSWVYSSVTKSLALRVFGFVCFVFFAGAHANQETTLDESALKQVGQAKFSFMFWDVYDSYLYTPNGEYTSGQVDTVVFKIRYLRNIDSNDLVESTIEQWQYIGLTKEQYSHYIPVLGDLWPDIKKDDELALKLTPERSTFYLNGKRLGEVNDKNFGDIFINIWLAENTSQPDLRAQLLGLAEQN